MSSLVVGDFNEEIGGQDGVHGLVSPKSDGQDFIPHIPGLCRCHMLPKNIGAQIPQDLDLIHRGDKSVVVDASPMTIFLELHMQAGNETLTGSSLQMTWTKKWCPQRMRSILRTSLCNSRGSCAVDQETLLGNYLDTDNVAEDLGRTSTLLVVKGTALLAYEQRCFSSKT